MARERFIRASEVGEYVYCRRAWWLHKIVGVEPTGRQRRAQGTALHTQHGRQVWLSHLLVVSSVLILLLAVLLLVVR